MALWRRLALAAVIAAATAGCSGQGERGKNKDLDRPKPAAEKQ